MVEMFRVKLFAKVLSFVKVVFPLYNFANRFIVDAGKNQLYFVFK